MVTAQFEGEHTQRIIGPNQRQHVEVEGFSLQSLDSLLGSVWLQDATESLPPKKCNHHSFNPFEHLTFRLF